MGLNDFDKINVDNNIDEKSKSKIFVEDDVEMLEDVDYWLKHLDELLAHVKEEHYNYVNAKIKYDFKKNDLQVNTKWDEENALRKTNGLPKITAQDQRNAVIDLKLKNLYIKVKDCELKYKFYKNIFAFINNNFELLNEMYVNVENSDKIE